MAHQDTVRQPDVVSSRGGQMATTETVLAKPNTRLQLLGRFALVLGGRNEVLGVGCRRLLAALALREGHAGRRELAGLLWPDVRAAQAASNLRSILWRLQRSCAGVVDSDAIDVRLSECLAVDIHQVVATARRLIDHSVSMSEDDLSVALASNFHDDLLPEMCDEEWLSATAERYRQLRIHAMESLSQRLTQLGWYGAAVDLALCAVHADPFRESAQRALMTAYIGEGNQLAARRQYHAYCEILHKELGLQPSARLNDLLHAA